MMYLDVRPRGPCGVVSLLEVGEITDAILREGGREALILHFPGHVNIECAGGGTEKLIIKAVRCGKEFGKKDTLSCLLVPPLYFPLENALIRSLNILGFRVMDGGQMAA